VQPGHVQHGDVTARVVGDHSRVELPVAGDDADSGRAGHHVRVRHHVLVGVNEAGALDAAVALRRFAVDLQHRTAGCRYSRRVQQRGIRRADIDDVRALQVAEHRRESAAVDVPAQRRVDVAHRRGHDPVDPAHNRRAAHCRRQRRVWRGRQRHGDHPGHQQHRNHAERGTDRGVDVLRRPPRDALTQVAAAPHRDQLAGHRERKHANDRDRYLRLPTGQGRPERPSQLCAQRGAAEEADQREQPDHGPVAVSADGVAHGGNHDDPVHDSHDQFGRTTSVPVIPWVTCSVHSNAYVPADGVVNVVDVVPPAFTRPV